jgi:hypothetical protein
MERLYDEMCNLEADFWLKDDWSLEAINTYKEKNTELKDEFNSLMVEEYGIENLWTTCVCGSYHTLRDEE